MRLVAAPTRACTGRRLTFQRRLVTLCAWLMRFPACGFLPQISHCCAMTTPRKIRSCRANLDFTGTWPDSAIPSRETETTKAPISRGQTKLWVLTAPCDTFSRSLPDVQSSSGAYPCFGSHRPCRSEDRSVDPTGFEHVSWVLQKGNLSDLPRAILMPCSPRSKPPPRPLIPSR